MRRAVVGCCLSLVVAAAGCSTFARSSSLSASTTHPTFGSLPPLESLGKVTTTTVAGQPGPTATTRRAPVSTAAPAGSGAPGATAPASSTAAIDAQPCANPTDRHAVDRTDPGGLFVRIGVAKNCVGRADRIELVVQVANPGKTTLYVSSAQRPLVSLLGAGGVASWSDPCEVKAPPPGSPPDVPVAIDPGKSVELAHVFYDPAASKCGVLGVGRYDGQASVAQCTAEDARDGVCDSPKRIATDKIGVEVR